MKDKLIAAKNRAKSLLAQPEFTCTVAGAVIGSATTAFVIYSKITSDYDNLLTLPLGKEAFNALVNDETNFVWFKSGVHDHVFHVTLAQ